MITLLLSASVTPTRWGYWLLAQILRILDLGRQ